MQVEYSKRRTFVGTLLLLAKKQLNLSPTDRKFVEEILQQGDQSARVIQRCQIVLCAAEGFSDRVIADQVGCSVTCVSNLRKRHATGGIKRALFDAPRKGAPRKFSDAQLAKIAEMYHGAPPTDHNRWTVELLCRESVKRGIVKSISVGRMFALLKEIRKDKAEN